MTKHPIEVITSVRSSLWLPVLNPERCFPRLRGRPAFTGRPARFLGAARRTSSAQEEQRRDDRACSSATPPRFGVTDDSTGVSRVQEMWVIESYAGCLPFDRDVAQCIALRPADVPVQQPWQSELRTNGVASARGRTI